VHPARLECRPGCTRRPSTGSPRRRSCRAGPAISRRDGRDTYRPFRSVSRDQMSGFLTRALAHLENEGAITPLPADETPETPEVIVEDRSVAPGEDIAFTIDAEDIVSGTVSGDCVDTAAYDEDADAAEAGFQVVVPVREDADAGECTVEVAFTRSAAARARRPPTRAGPTPTHARSSPPSTRRRWRTRSARTSRRAP
jgi:hypothetical protein